MTDSLRANGHLVDDLSSVARHGGSALTDGPALLRRVLEEDAWREFVTQRGDHVKHRTFFEFVATRPLKGLGADMELIDRIVGTADPDLLRLLRDAKKVGSGHPRDSDSESLDSETASYQADRLYRDHPEQYAAVRAGELSVNAAAVAAGIRPRRISVRTDDPDSIARSLRKHMSPEAFEVLRNLLLDEDTP